MSKPSNPGTALITGASTGIGSVYAHRLAQRGYNLILVARDRERLTNLANDIAAKTDRNAEALPADLTVKADLKRVEDRLRSDSTITAVVNNAGFGGVAKLIDSNVDDMDNMIQLNVTALTRLTSAALPGFLERSKGLLQRAHHQHRFRRRPQPRIAQRRLQRHQSIRGQSHAIPL
ncbi:MAG: SDR family NAD(P)-dependent oxidoreductase [Terracidiphilus sp.]